MPKKLTRKNYIRNEKFRKVLQTNAVDKVINEEELRNTYLKREKKE